MLDKLYCHFRKYWPKKEVAQSDAYGVTPGNPDGSEATAQEQSASETEPAGSPCELQGGEADDLDLARALGVPEDCIERLTPQKTKASDPESSQPVPPTHICQEEGRKLRIQELKRFNQT